MLLGDISIDMTLIRSTLDNDMEIRSSSRFQKITSSPIK